MHIQITSSRNGLLTMSEDRFSNSIQFLSHSSSRSYSQASSPDRPHETNASLIIGSEQLPLYSKKARNVYLFVRANTNQIKSEIICSLSNNGLIKLTHLSYPFKKCPASCSKEKHSSFIMLFFTFFSNDSLYVFFNSIHPSISNTSCSYL